MNEMAGDVRQTLPRHLSSDFLLPSVNGNMVTMAFKWACRRMGIADFHPHNLRHTFGSPWNCLTCEGFSSYSATMDCE
jgi:integrase